jgi:UDP-glucuronate decarboxylase
LLGSFAAGRFSAAWGRVFHLYGPEEEPSRLVPSVIGALLDGRDALCTEGTQVRDFMHVADLGDAFAALVASPVEGAVNVASGRAIRLADLILEIGAQMDAPDRIRLGARAMPAGELPRVTASVTRLRDEVGWTSARELDRGLAGTIAWWRQELSGR